MDKGVRRLLPLLLVPWLAIAETGTEEGNAVPEGIASPPRSRAPLELDRLLRPPKLKTRAPERLGGKDREQWGREFSEARSEIRALEERISESQQRIREASGGDWSFSPTGGGAPIAPEVLQLRAELRRDRQSLGAARQRLRDLEVEASLAGVPDSWIKVREPD
ncbi:MAG: hypothetical protein ACE5FG_10070 [Myxococcota bacterium]